MSISLPVHHHHQDDLIYPPLDFATPTPQVVDTPHPVPSSSHLMGNQQSLDGNVSNSLGVTSDNLLPPSLVNSNTSVTMETSGNGDVSMQAMPQEHPPSSPESEDLPLARRTRPSRSTRPQKSFAEQDDEDEDEEYEQKPPKGLTNLYHEESAPTLVGGQSIFSSLIQKERRTRLTKGAKKKKKTEPEFCRFCFTNELSLQKIRTVKLPPTSPHATTKFTTLVPAVTDIALSLTEKWTNPSFQLVCDECVMVFASFYEFRQAVETNDQLLRRLYCKSKAKSKKPPATPATPTSAGKGKRRSNYKDPTSDDDSDARSTVSKRKTNRGRKKGVTDDEETDGYLSSVSKTSRKSTTSRRGGSKKKRGVTTDEDTDGYMSSVSRKSVNTTTSTAKNAKKKRRYNSDSDNEDVKSDVSDGMDFGPTAYDLLRIKMSDSEEGESKTKRESNRNETKSDKEKNEKKLGKTSAKNGTSGEKAEKWRHRKFRRSSTSSTGRRRIKSEPDNSSSDGDTSQERRRRVKSENDDPARHHPSDDEFDETLDESDGVEALQFEEMVFTCRFCADAFKSHDALMRHYKATHATYEVSLLCYFCGHIAKNIHSLTSHLRGLHQLPRKTQKILCEVCSVEVLHIAEHIRSAHSGLSFECSQCRRVFTRKCDLRMHIKRIHMKSELEERFVCGFCSKVFNFYWYMKRHERIHTGERPYKCKLCSVAFNHMVSLKNHQKKCCPGAGYGASGGGMGQPMGGQQQAWSYEDDHKYAIH
ncbi:hypothetical protein M8J75_013112 [Diaphorina citri]|nr:hypothetical protein M8J75_013112 [Diaphorina citri]